MRLGPMEEAGRLWRLARMWLGHAQINVGLAGFAGAAKTNGGNWCALSWPAHRRMSAQAWRSSACIARVRVDGIAPAGDVDAVLSRPPPAAGDRTFSTTAKAKSRRVPQGARPDDIPLVARID